MRNAITILFLLMCIGNLRAQDPHFSQFFASPLTLNPANTGNFNGIGRVAGNIRNQWSRFNNAYSTATLSYDAPIHYFKKNANDVLSGGVLMLYDQSGNGLLRNTHLSIAASYKKILDIEELHSISIGFMGNVGQYRFDPSRANFEDELTPLGFSSPTQETFFTNNTQKQYVDVSAGIRYQGSTNEDNLFYIGLSAYHLNTPTMGFSDATDFLRIRYGIQAGGFAPLGERLTLHYSAQFQQQYKYQETIAGVALSSLLQDQEKHSLELFAGAWARWNDAIIPYFGIDRDHISLGFSYDIKYNAKTTMAAYGGPNAEFSFIWHLFKQEDYRPIKCPKF